MSESMKMYLAALLSLQIVSPILAMGEDRSPSETPKQPRFLFVYPQPEEDGASSDEEVETEPLKPEHVPFIQQLLAQIKQNIAQVAQHPINTKSVLDTLSAHSDLPTTPLKKFVREQIAILKSEKGALNARPDITIVHANQTLEQNITQNLQPHFLLISITMQLTRAEVHLRNIQLFEQHQNMQLKKEEVTEMATSAAVILPNKKTNP